MIKVLVVDASPGGRKIVSRELSKAPDIEVVGTAVDPYDARDKIVALSPDVITLDLEMPRMDGLTFLGKLMEHAPMPVVVMSALTAEGSDAALEALERGAVDVVCKPSSASTLKHDAAALIDKVRVAANAHCVKRVPRSREPRVQVGQALATPASSSRIVAIGASTGGTEAIRAVLEKLPATTPGIVIVIHMPEHFTAAFAKRLDRICPMKVREAASGDDVVPGLALVAPGGHHMLLKKTGARYRVELMDGPREHYQRPAVDVLFRSVAECAGANAVGALLTGMGADGATGLLAMQQAGASTLAQDEESCVVFGMPMEAIKLGAAEEVVALPGMANAVVRALNRARPRR